MLGLNTAFLFQALRSVHIVLVPGTLWTTILVMATGNGTWNLRSSFAVRIVLLVGSHSPLATAGQVRPDELHSSTLNTVCHGFAALSEGWDRGHRWQRLWFQVALLTLTIFWLRWWCHFGGLQGHEITSMILFGTTLGCSLLRLAALFSSYLSKIFRQTETGSVKSLARKEVSTASHPATQLTLHLAEIIYIVVKSESMCSNYEGQMDTHCFTIILITHSG